MGEPAQVVESVAAKYGAADLQITSQVNYVGVADERFVIKAPQSTQSMSSLIVEAATLAMLRDGGPLAVKTPELVAFSADPLYLVATYLPGKVIEAADLPKITPAERNTLGHDIGAYVLSQAAQIDVATAQHQIPPLDRKDTWESIFADSLGDFSASAFPAVSSLSHKLHNRWQQYQGNTASEQFIHGDLRLGNMAVSADYRLQGVFDFGRAGVGTVSGEISPLANLDTTILQGVIDELRTAAVDIDMEEIHTWDEMKKLAQLANYIKAENYRSEPPLFVKRACDMLRNRHPELDWSELNQLF